MVGGVLVFVAARARGVRLGRALWGAVVLGLGRLNKTTVGP